MTPHPRYPSLALPLTHPLRLEAHARLHGLGGRFGDGLGEAFRYLELGCGDGTNLIGLAVRFPEASFAGVDIAADLIEVAREAASRCGVDNVEFSAQDLVDYEPPPEPFDFVVSYGVYSWVSAETRSGLLALCHRVLSPFGVALLSYNAMPGWSIGKLVRDAMLHAAGAATRDADRLRLARAALVSLRRDLPEAQHSYVALMGSEIDRALEKSDGYLLSEFLAPHCEAFYFRDVVREAAEHELAYVAELTAATGEGDLECELLPRLLQSGTPRAEAEQRLDMVSYRRFRASLFCQASAAPRAEPDYGELARSGLFAGRFEAASEEPLLGPGKAQQFRTANGVVIECDRPLLKAALLLLGQAWPAGVSAQRLIGAALEELRARELLHRVGIDEEEIARTVTDLVELCRRHHAELLPWSPTIERELGARPAVHAWTRLEAERGSFVTGPRHEPVEVDPLARAALSLLDGASDVRDLVRGLATFVDSGAVQIEGVDPSAAQDPRLMAELVAHAVARARDLGLLIAPEPPLMTS